MSGTLPEGGCLLNSALPLITTVKILECGKGEEWEKSFILSVAVGCISGACCTASAIDYLWVLIKKTDNQELVSTHGLHS